MRSTSLAALVASVSAASAAVHQGFNYGASNTDGSIRTQQIFQDEFKVAKNLVGTSGFTSARLYTCIQGGTANEPISAIPAAIAEDTTILLGIWASAGQTGIDNEIAALKNAISQYGDKFTSLVTGLSVGSEDLYRNSPTGIAAKSGYGAQPDELVSYIKQVRAALADTALSGVQIGHVDTWNDWVNGSNSAVINAVDWLGVDAYPYFQSTIANSIEDGPGLLWDAYDATVNVAGGKDVWITETGWPVSGPQSGQAEANTKNAQYFWEKVACPAMGKINTYWYTLQDANPVAPSPSFGIVGSELSTTPLFDLTCPAGDSTTSAAPSSSATSTKEVATPVESAPASSLLATGGGGLTPSQGAGNGGNGGVSSLVTSVKSDPAPQSTVLSASASSAPTSAAANGSGSVAPSGAAPTAGAGSAASSAAAPTGGAGAAPSGAAPSGGAGADASGSVGAGSPVTPTTMGNGTVVTPTAGASTTAFTAGAAAGGAGSLFAGAVGAVVAVMAAL